MEPTFEQTATQAHASIASVLPTEPFQPLKRACLRSIRGPRRDTSIELSLLRVTISAFQQELAAFHSYSNDASRHVEAVHICTHLGPEMHQCVPLPHSLHRHPTG